jgi:hypothetical protein
MKKKTAALIIGLVFVAAKPVFAQVPSATRSTTNQSSTSAGRFGTDIDNYMGTRNWPGMGFDRHFFFIGGRYQTMLAPALGYAAKLGDYYLGLYFRGTVLQGDNSHHNGLWDSEWDKDGNGRGKFILNDSAAILLGVPNIGGFRFDWIAGNGTDGAGFEKFKGIDDTFNGETVDSAEGKASGSMAFLLSYGNTFAGKFKVDAIAGYATPETIKVTGGQVGTDIFEFTQTDKSRVYMKLGTGYNLNDTSSVDADYSFILMPGIKWEQTKGAAITSKTAEANVQNIINVSYSKTIVWDDKISMKIKPNIGFDILSEKDIYETESGKTDNGKQTTLKLIPSIAMGVEYKATGKLSLYTGTTVTLFDFASKKAEKGADGFTYGNDNSGSDIIQGSELGFDLGASFALTDTLTLDFNGRTLLNSIFVTASPSVDVYLTFRK